MVIGYLYIRHIPKYGGLGFPAGSPTAMFLLRHAGMCWPMGWQRLAAVSMVLLSKKKGLKVVETGWWWWLMIVNWCVFDAYWCLIMIVNQGFSRWFIMVDNLKTNKHWWYCEHRRTWVLGLHHPRTIMCDAWFCHATSHDRRFYN